MASRFAESGDGARLAYEVSGSGPVVVLVHGITESRATWAPVVSRLEPDFTVVAVDLRGHGESSRVPPYDALTFTTDLAAVIEALGVTHPAVVGHSVGAVVATFAAASGATGRVVNIDQSFAFTEFARAVRGAAETLRGPGFGEFVRELFADLGVDRVPEPSRSLLESLHRSAEQEVVLGIWDLLLTADDASIQAIVEQTLAAVSVPYLALHGTDPGTDYLAWLRTTVPTAAVEVWGDCHWPHLVDPDRFAARVRSFLVDRRD